MNHPRQTSKMHEGMKIQTVLLIRAHQLLSTSFHLHDAQNRKAEPVLRAQGRDLRLQLRHEVVLLGERLPQPPHANTAQKPAGRCRFWFASPRPSQDVGPRWKAGVSGIGSRLHWLEDGHWSFVRILSIRIPHLSQIPSSNSDAPLIPLFPTVVPHAHGRPAPNNRQTLRKPSSFFAIHAPASRSLVASHFISKSSDWN